MTRKQSPAFQLYADDFYAGTADMSLEEVGGYMRLLCAQWSKQKLPNDARILQRLMIANSEEFNRIWPVLSKKFGLSIEDGIGNPRMEAVRSIQLARRKSGRKGGKAKRVAKRKQNVSTKPARKEMETGEGEGVRKEEMETEIPTEIDTPEFRVAWSEWIEYRREKRKPVSVRATTKQLAELAAMGTVRAIAAIENSIRHDYQGIYEASNGPPKRQKQSAARFVNKGNGTP